MTIKWKSNLDINSVCFKKEKKKDHLLGSLGNWMKTLGNKKTNSYPSSEFT